MTDDLPRPAGSCRPPTGGVTRSRFGSGRDRRQASRQNDEGRIQPPRLSSHGKVAQPLVDPLCSGQAATNESWIANLAGPPFTAVSVAGFSATTQLAPEEQADWRGSASEKPLWNELWSRHELVCRLPTGSRVFGAEAPTGRDGRLEKRSGNPSACRLLSGTSLRQNH